MREIAARGRRFFHHEGRYGQFELVNGRLMWRDEYSNKLVWPYSRNGNRHAGFSHGGTLWMFVNELRKFVMTGTPLAYQLFSKHWGYPEEDLEALREVGRNMGLLSTPEDIEVINAVLRMEDAVRPAGSIFRIVGSPTESTVIMEWQTSEGEPARVWSAGPFQSRSAAMTAMKRLEETPEAPAPAPAPSL